MSPGWRGRKRPVEADLFIQESSQLKAQYPSINHLIRAWDTANQHSIGGGWPGEEKPTKETEIFIISSTIWYLLNSCFLSININKGAISNADCPPEVFSSGRLPEGSIRSFGETKDLMEWINKFWHIHTTEYYSGIQVMKYHCILQHR